MGRAGRAASQLGQGMLCGQAGQRRGRMMGAIADARGVCDRGRCVLLGDSPGRYGARQQQGLELAPRIKPRRVSGRGALLQRDRLW